MEEMDYPPHRLVVGVEVVSTSSPPVSWAMEWSELMGALVTMELGTPMCTVSNNVNLPVMQIVLVPMLISQFHKLIFYFHYGQALKLCLVKKNPGFICKQMLDEFQVCWDVNLWEGGSILVNHTQQSPSMNMIPLYAVYE